MQKCAVLLAGLALFSSGCHFKAKDLLRDLEAGKVALTTVTVSPVSASLPCIRHATI